MNKQGGGVYRKENNNFNLVTNETGESFYKKWKKDTKQSVFLYAPISLIISLMCFTMIAGISLKLFIILIVPIVMIGITFVYIPFFTRRKYINYLVKNISVNSGICTIETYKWFLFKSILVSSEITNIEVVKSTDQPYFKEKSVFLIKFKKMETETFYVIGEFFDGSVDYLKHISE